ncbi:MAG: SDR family oxidoreductase [Synergistaceae bacterium]|nr:SDR family oxidoreductase [Synergistaceae bacterium]
MTPSEIFSLKGRTILVTGASSGIGRCVAERASQMGARLLLLGRDEARLKETMGQLEGDGHRCVAMDLHATENIEPELGDVLKEAGPLNGFVHRAGVSEAMLLRDMDLNDMDRMMQLNWLSFMSLTKSVCRRGHYAQGMSVVALASIAALMGQTALSAYAASKGALISAVHSLASEYASRGIRFNCVSPAPVDTPMQRQTRERLGEEWYKKEVLEKAKLGTLAPEDVADPILFLLSDASRRVTGINMVVDGGWSLS